MSGIVGGVGSRSGIIGSTDIPGGYEEGTWEAGYSGTTASSITNSTGYYTRIGRMVYFQYYSDAVTFASSSGAATITGLPFTASGAYKAYAVFGYEHGNAVDASSTGGYVNPSTNNLRFVDRDGTSSATFINGTKYLMVSGFYFID